MIPRLIAFLRWWGRELAGLVPDRLLLLRLGRRRLIVSWRDDGPRLTECRGSRVLRDRPFGHAGRPPGRFNRPTVILRFPAEAGLHRRVTLPRAADAALDRVLRFEIDRLTPWPADSVAFGARRLGPAKDGATIGVELSAMPRAQVDAALAALAKAGWTPDVVDLATDDPAGPAGPDLRHSIDFAERLDAGPIAVAGRCSGAYAAFVTAVQDPRIHCVVPINMLRYVWDPEETVEQALQSAHRSVGGSVSKLFSKQSLRRLLSGNLRLWAPAVFLGKRVVRSVLARLRRGLAGASGASLYSECHRRFQVLEERGVRVAIVISEGDHAQGEFQAYMGRDGARLQRYPQASLTIIPDADHDFTHADARARLTNVLCDVISGDWSAVPRAQPAAHAGAYREIARS